MRKAIFEPVRGGLWEVRNEKVPVVFLPRAAWQKNDWHLFGLVVYAPSLET